MTRLPAKVLSKSKRGDQYCVTVEIGVSNFRRSFNSLLFGEQIPFSGSYRNGTLELRYYQDPGVKVGQQFPLWLIEANRLVKHSVDGPHCGLDLLPEHGEQYPIYESASGDASPSTGA
jgi:hypothetical protein